MVDQNSIPSGQKFLVGAQTPRQMELIQELRQAGASVAELPTGPVNPEPTAFEARPFRPTTGSGTTPEPPGTSPGGPIWSD